MRRPRRHRRLVRTRLRRRRLMRIFLRTPYRLPPRLPSAPTDQDHRGRIIEKGPAMQFKTIDVDGLNIFSREAGDPDVPKVLLVIIPIPS
jgi:hypothetical protein